MGSVDGLNFLKVKAGDTACSLLSKRHRWHLYQPDGDKTGRGTSGASPAVSLERFHLRTASRLLFYIWAWNLTAGGRVTRRRHVTAARMNASLARKPAYRRRGWLEKQAGRKDAGLSRPGQTRMLRFGKPAGKERGVAS